jgi:hypothetical protein
MSIKLVLPHLFNYPNGLDLYPILFSVPSNTFSSPFNIGDFGFDTPDSNEALLPLWSMQELLGIGILRKATVRVRKVNSTHSYDIPYYAIDDVGDLRSIFNGAISSNYRGGLIISFSLVSGKKLSSN